MGRKIATGQFDFGFTSPHWMLKALLMYVPRPQLNLGVARMIDFMVYTEGEWGIEDAFGVLAQYALIGQYVPPGTDVEMAEDGTLRLAAQSEEDKPATELSEVDIDRAVEEFRKLLDSMPTADDPMIDFSSDEDSNEKEDK